MTAHQHYQAGRLDEAITAATEDVRKSPRALAPRMFLAELLCFRGDLERADKQLDALAQQQPDLAVAVSLFRQLIRAEQARHQCFTEGRLPEFLTEPDEAMKARLEASVLVREGAHDEAAARLAPLNETAISARLDGQAADLFRDLDDLLAGVFDVHTSNGRYFWIPMQQVEQMSFHKPERPIDLIWRAVTLTVAGGPEGVVYMPALYPGSATSEEDAIRLGRATEWITDRGPVRGLGQRMFIVGDEARGIMELTALELTGSTPSAAS